MAMNTINKFALGVIALGFVNTVAFASNPAFDNASLGPYNGTSWNNGDNGGSGFTAWGFFNSNTTNGFSGQYTGTTGEGTPGWGLFASDNVDSGGNGNSSAMAFRSFTGGPLAANQKFSLDLGATSSVFLNSTIGFSLMDGFSPIVTFEYTGGQTFWQFNDGGSNFDTTIPFQGNTKVSFSFTYNGGLGYTVIITDGTNTYSGVNFTASQPISNLTGFILFNNGQGTDQNIGFNNLAVTTVPEPTTALLLSSTLFIGLFIRRRRDREFH
ncbi:MAG: hypothetical protein QOG67_987 [Verrucomicrobiota bacterium]|jgi:hypothetical protein